MSKVGPQEKIVTLPTIALTRALVGLAQGIILYLLYQAQEAKTWPATDGVIFAAALGVALFVPLIVIAGLRNLRPWTLAIWTIAPVVICAGLVGYDIFRDPELRPELSRILPGPRLWLTLSAILFIVHSLVVAGETDRRVIAGYGKHFDVAWKHGLQVALAAVFVGVFWLVLWLGASLFELIKLTFLTELIRKSWFWIPVTALATACAIHLTDVHAGILRGTRALALTMLAWLLPVMTVIGVGFLLALPFTGLEPLWSTRRATSILLTATAALILLINAAYQDGNAETPVARLMRYASVVATFVLPPLVALAGYGLWLRVSQYGWTPERITAVACVTVAACYAGGYAVAIVLPRARVRGLESTNVFTSLVILAVLLALFTPIADPARIAVADQVARLESGEISPDKFDFAFLRFQSGRYGRQALERLKRKEDGPDALRIRSRRTRRWIGDSARRRKQPFS